MEINSVIDNNLKLLMNSNNIIEISDDNDIKLTVEEAKAEGYYTASLISDNKKIQLCSKYNPEQEAKRFVESYEEQIKTAEKIVLYGFGLGYHVLELSKYNKELIVIECNTAVFNKLISSIDFSIIFNKENVKYIVSNNLDDVSNVVSGLSDEDLFLIHQPSLDIIPYELESLKIAIKNYAIKVNNIRNNRELLLKNKEINLKRNDMNFRLLKGIFQGRNVVLVSAGPSLINSLSLLKKMSNNVIICCVGRALKPLLENGIIPDVTIIVDPHEIVSNQFNGLSSKVTSRIKLFYSESACPSVMDNYLGEKYIVDSIDSGGSVATTLFSALCELKVMSIALVGQDLAYSNDRTHIDKHTNINANNLLKVKGIKDNTVFTNYSLNIFKQWFEMKANDIKDISLYNCTDEGAYIKGFLHISLEDYFNKISS